MAMFTYVGISIYRLISFLPLCMISALQYDTEAHLRVIGMNYFVPFCLVGYYFRYWS